MSTVPTPTFGRAAEVEREGAEERAVAAVGERRDDEPRRVAEVLVAVLERRVDHARRRVRLLPVVAQLAQPVEVVLRRHPLLDQRRQHVAGVHVEHDQRLNTRTSR